MKKKILLLTVAVFALACLFVISAGAESIIYEGQEIELVNNLGNPTWYTGTTASKITDKESVVILKDAEGKMTAYPSYYIFRYVISGSTVYVDWANNKGVDYSFINENATKNYTSGSIHYVEFPKGITASNYVDIWGRTETNVVEVVFPDSVTSIGYNAFQGAKKLKKIIMPKGLKTIESFAFYGIGTLETIVFPEGCAIETIGEGNFESCSRLSNVNLENCQSLKILGPRTFNGCSAIDKLYLPDSLQSIGDNALNNLGDIELASNYLPSSLKSIGSYFLANCNLKNDVIYFPVGVTSLNPTNGFCFYNCIPKTSLTLVFLGKMTDVNLGSVSLANVMNSGSKQPLKLIFAQNQFSDLNNDIVSLVEANGQKGFIAVSVDGSPLYTTGTGTLSVTFDNSSTYNTTNIGKDINGNTVYALGTSASEIIFCGGDTVEISYTIRCNHTNAAGKWYRFHTTPETYDVKAHETTDVHYNNRVYQAVNCGYDEVTTTTCVICDLQSVVVGEKATGKHSCTDDFNCETSLVCDVCEKTIKEAMLHNMITRINYVNGYENVGVKAVECENNGCTVCNVNEAAEAMFTCLGYSVYEGGNKGIAIGYTVSFSAVVEFETVNGQTVKYGVFAVSQEKLGDAYVFGKDGEVTKGAICADVSKHGLAAFELKIVGFANDQTDIPLAMGAYVLVKDGENVKYSYMQSESPTDDNKYSFVSYDGVLAQLKK